MEFWKTKTKKGGETSCTTVISEGCTAVCLLKRTRSWGRIDVHSSRRARKVWRRRHVTCILLLFLFSIRQCAAWPSTLITAHNVSRKKKATSETKRKPMHHVYLQSTLPPFGLSTPFAVFAPSFSSRQYFCWPFLEPESRFGGKPFKFQVVCPQNGTAFLKKGVIGLKTSSCLFSPTRYSFRFLFVFAFKYIL